MTVRDDDKILSVLTLYHTLEYTCGFLMGIYGGATITYLQSLKPKNILATMRETGTTTMLGVPTLYNLIREDIERRILKSKKSFFKNGFLEGSRKINASLEKRFGRNLGRKMFAAVHEEFGGKIRIFVSGGSALGEDLFYYFKTLGMPIYEGYGLTETAPVLTVSPLHRGRAGSAGKPLPGVEIRLYHSDSDGVGEIIVRTPSLMKGYYKNPDATSEVVRDGWFHTGDLGWVDGDGYLYITGRIKDVIVTGAGKNVYPTDLEAIYRQLPGIEDICVFGIRSGLTEEVNAVICPSPEILAEEDKAKAEKTLQNAIQTLARELPSYNRLQALHFVSQLLHRKSEGGLDRARIKQEVMEVSGRMPRTKKGFSLPREKDSKVSKRKLLLKELSRLSGLEAEEISEESHLYTDLGLDSLMALELLLSMEQNFGVVIPDEKAASLQTVKDVLDEVRRIGLKPEKQSSPKIHRSTLSLKERSLIDRTILRMSFQALRNFSRTYFDLKLVNESAIPESGAYILAANHASHLDTVVMISGLTHALGVRKSRRLHIIGARDYFFEGLFKSWFFSTCMNVVPIERDELSLNGLRQLSSILAAGEPILIFPEGTRSRTGQIQEFKPGVGLVAWEQKVPILPVFLDGTYDAMPAGKSLPKRTPISVVFGNMIKMREYEKVAAAITKDNLYRIITADVKTAIETMKKVAGC
ncbi:MAG: AMP-binding protein, partial [Acidobacteriota bacterium]